MPKQIATYNIPNNKWDLSQVAKHLGFSESYIRDLTRDGKLKAQKFQGSANKNWYDIEEVKLFKKFLAKIRKD